MLCPSLLLGAPLVWTAHRIAGVHCKPVLSSTVRMASGVEEMAQAYTGIFAQSPGISRAWALPNRHDGAETLMVQRTARDIEGGDRDWCVRRVCSL